MRNRMYSGVCVIFLMAVLQAAATVSARAADVPEYPFRDTSLPVEERAADLVSRLTLDEKAGLLSYMSDPVPRLGIDHYYFGNEALHGVVRPGKFTVFPQAIALAATWDPGLIHEVTTAISDEARGKNNTMGGNVDLRSSGLLTFWSPTVNMARDPRWGRTPETYGEDPYLTSRIGVAFVTGLQGDDPEYTKVVSTPKHFVANNEEHNRLRCNPQISERSLREYYFPGFKACVTEGGARSVMGAYNALNGIPCNANRWLLTEVLRGEWGFDGYVVTDCGAVSTMISEHQYAESRKEAAALAINAGVDLECGRDEIIKENIAASLDAGLTTIEDIDRAVTRVLRERFRLGMFDPPEDVPYTKIPGEAVGSEEHQQLALRTARESMVLLKNEPAGDGPLLPLDPAGLESIAVVGPIANVCRFGDYSGSPLNEPVTPLAGIVDRLPPGVKVNHAEWIPAPGEDDYRPVPAENMVPAGRLEGHGLRGEYWGNLKFEGRPETTRVDEIVDIDTLNRPPDPAIPRGDFSARWSGKLVPSVSGEYLLSIYVEGSVRMMLDGKALLQRKAVKPPSFRAGQPIDVYVIEQNRNKRLEAAVMLEEGREYDIRIDYRYSGGNAIVRLDWIPPSVEKAEARRRELDMIAGSDVVVAVLGIGREDEREGLDRQDLDLPAYQRDYIRQVMAANPETVVVLVSGSPLSVNWIDEHVPAVVQAWYPGEQGGNAIADVLFGSYNPAGRLPVTFHASVDELPPFDDYEIFNGRTYMYFEGDPLYPFGHGLSFTSFEYSDLDINAGRVRDGDTVKVALDVTNTGGRGGDEVVQLYVRDVEASVKTPLKKLLGFRRIHLEKGEKGRVEFELPVESLAYWDEDANKFVVEPGGFEVMAGASSSDIRLSGTFEVVE